MSVPTVPPPTYEQQHAHRPSDDFRLDPSEAQLLISPTVNASSFQSGHLGAPAERAAIEGELQIKGVPVSLWTSLTVSLTSTESAAERQIELNVSTVDLFSRDGASASSRAQPLPVGSSVPFSIPLTPDTPECLHVGRSSLTHVLSATLQTTAPSLPVLKRSIDIHLRRYSSHLLKCEINPLKVSLTHPTPVDVQIPRTTYRLNEPIPVYITIPPPHRSVILDHGYTLRSVRAELIRSVKRQIDTKDAETASLSKIRLQDNEADISDEDDDDSSDSASSDGVPPSAEFASGSAGHGPYSPPPLPTIPENSIGSPYEAVIARSGSSCRFHTSKAVKIRLVLHGSLPGASPLSNAVQLCEGENTFVDSESSCSSITQTTVLHSVEFRVQVRVTFLHVTTRSEQTYPVIIPLTILPPPAPLPEIDPTLDAAYAKKHDRPPLKTVRREDSDVYMGDNHELNQAGPSALPSGAPPPFDDAPPPFFSYGDGEASTSSRLPTFMESESEIIVPASDHPASLHALPPAPAEMSFEGEGVLFGFPASERYDGHSDVMARSSTPPPTLEMSEVDANVTALADLANQPERAINALSLALEQHEERTRNADADDMLPPPPPPMDDPSDPPPSIDSDFRSHRSDQAAVAPPASTLSRNVSPPMGRVPSLLEDAGVSAVEIPVQRTRVPEEESSAISPSHAPPPYLNAVPIGDSESASGPPPYIDLVANNANQSR